MSEPDETDRDRLARCTACGRLHPATISNDELVPARGRRCESCRNDEFVPVVLDVDRPASRNPPVE